MLRRDFLILLLAVAALAVLISVGCDDLVTQTIKTTIAGNPTAEFAVTPDSGCIPLTVTFSDASSGPVRTWIWNFGDSTWDTVRLADSANGDIKHTYTRSGAFTVTLSVLDSLDGSDSEAKKRAVVVGHNVDSVTLSDNYVCPGDSIAFTAHNPYGVSRWSWAFGDGTSTADNSVVQKHAYASAGIYEFKLTVTGDCGSKVIIDTVHVIHCARAYFTADPDTGCVPLTVVFTDSSQPPSVLNGDILDTVGTIVHWSWTFGNGVTRQFDGPPAAQEIVYGAAGSFPVTLTVTTDSGGITSFRDTIVAYPALAATFTAVPTSGCQTQGRQFLVAFTRVATGDKGWIWDFGDGDTSHAQNPYHAYSTPGYYTVRLDVIGGCGTNDTTTVIRDSLVRFSDQIDPAPDFSYSHVSDTSWRTVTFVDQTIGDTVFTRLWTIGGTGAGTTDTVIHRFADTGFYVVKLVRRNDCDSAFVTKTIHLVDSLTLN